MNSEFKKILSVPQVIGLLLLALLGIYFLALTNMDGAELTSEMWERRLGDFMLAEAALAYVIYFLERSLHSKRGLQAEE